METKPCHVRIPDQTREKVEEFQEKNELRTFSQALVAVINRYFEIEQLMDREEN